MQLAATAVFHSPRCASCSRCRSAATVRWPFPCIWDSQNWSPLPFSSLQCSSIAQGSDVANPMDCEGQGCRPAILIVFNLGRLAAPSALLHIPILCIRWSSLSSKGTCLILTWLHHVWYMLHCVWCESTRQNYFGHGGMHVYNTNPIKSHCKNKKLDPVEQPLRGIMWLRSPNHMGRENPLNLGFTL
jgi:hypothetical protein